MGFSITSAVLGGIIIIFYSIAISDLRRYHSYNEEEYYYYRYGITGEKQLSWKDGHSCQHACLGQSYIRCWNLGSDLHLFDEAMRLLRTAVGKLRVLLGEIHQNNGIRLIFI